MTTFTCSTCQRQTPVVVWQGVTLAKGTKLERNATWQLCRECFVRERRAEEGK